MNTEHLLLHDWHLPADFMTKHWRHSPALGRVTDLAPANGVVPDASTLLAHGPRADRVTISTTGRMHHPAEYTSPRILAGQPVADVVDADRVRALVAGGATAILANTEHWVPTVTRAAETLASHFGCEVQAHVFMTGPGRRGLVPHADGEDNFLIQTDGTKKWSLWHATGIKPEHLDPADLGEPTETVSLNPGDVLYIPIGWIHTATAGDTGSTHITYQVVPNTLLDAVLDQLADELEPLLGDRLHAAHSDAPLDPDTAAKLAHHITQLLDG